MDAPAWSATDPVLAALTPEQRAAITDALAARVEQSLREVLEHWYSTSAQDGPRIDVFGAERRDGTLVLHVIADHYNYNYAQSGSDWADHYIYAGTATVVGGALADVALEQVHHQHLTEYEDSSYEPRAVRDRWRDQLRKISRNS